eukprot:4025307-Amphidinium_carterae.1
MVLQPFAQVALGAMICLTTNCGGFWRMAMATRRPLFVCSCSSHQLDRGNMRANQRYESHMHNSG